MFALAQDCDTVKKLSALAQLVRLHAERGITSTHELAGIIGYSERAIRRAKADAGFRSATRPPVATRPPASDEPGHPWPPNALPSPLKKKGLPRTPSKEKTNPPPESQPGDLLNHTQLLEQAARARRQQAKLMTGKTPWPACQSFYKCRRRKPTRCFKSKWQRMACR